MAPNFRYEEIIQFTPREEAEYVYRRLLMKKIDDEYALMQKQYGDKLPASYTKEMSRWKQIVNQTNPSLLFKHLPDKKLDELILEQRKSAVTRPSTKTGMQVPGKPPDDSIFSSMRRVINSSLHHLRPIQRNQNAVDPSWNDHEIKAWHETLDEANTDAGSGYRTLAEGPEVDHQGRKATPGSVPESVHAGESDAEPYQYQQKDPRARAGEYILQNEAEFQRGVDIFEDPTRISGQLRASAQADWEAAGGEGELFTDKPMTPEQRKWLKSGKNFSETTNQLIDMGNKGTLGVPYSVTRDLMGKLGVSKFFQQMTQGKIPLAGITKGAVGGAVLGAKPGRADIGTFAKATSGDFEGVRDDVLSGSIWGGAIGGLTELAGRVGLQRAGMAILGKTPPALLGQGIAGVTFQNPEVVEKYAAADNPVDRLKAIPQAFLPDLTEEERKKMEEENEKRLSTPSASTMMSGTAAPRSTRPTTWQEAMFDREASSSP